jgi:hypothetical protein
MSTKNQQTFAKLARERRLKEKRERKAEKKAAALAAKAGLADDGSAAPAEDQDTPTTGDGNVWIH